MKTFGKGRPAAAAGFTLVELVVVILIVSILAAIAIPSYRHQVQKSRRTDAKSALLDLAARQERYNSTHNAYATDALTLGYQTAFPVIVGSQYYNLQLAGTATTFTATATPINSQTTDTECGNFTLDQTGVQGVSGSLGAASCWN